jgi:hypothetical protein
LCSLHALPLFPYIKTISAMHCLLWLLRCLMNTVPLWLPMLFERSFLAHPRQWLIDVVYFHGVLLVLTIAPFSYCLWEWRRKELTFQKKFLYFEKCWICCIHISYAIWKIMSVILSTKCRWSPTRRAHKKTHYVAGPWRLTHLHDAHTSVALLLPFEEEGSLEDTLRFCLLTNV